MFGIDPLSLIAILLFAILVALWLFARHWERRTDETQELLMEIRDAVTAGEREAEKLREEAEFRELEDEITAEHAVGGSKPAQWLMNDRAFQAGKPLPYPDLTGGTPHHRRQPPDG
jgi:hypothetical protein